MSIFTPYRASLFGALDSAAIASGRGPNAYELRAMIGAANRLISKPELCARMSWNTGGTLGEGGISAFEDLHGWGLTDEWMQLEPAKIPIKKKPFLNRYTAMVMAYLSANSKHLLQFETSLHPFNASAAAGDEFVLELDGSGTDDWVEASTDFPSPTTLADWVRVWMRSEHLTTLMSEGTYGTLNEGEIDNVTSFGPVNAGLWVVVDDDAAWNTSGFTPANGGHVVSFWDQNDVQVMGPCRILGQTATSLQISPKAFLGIPLTDVLFSSLISAALIGCKYKIFKLPEYRFADIALYGQERLP